MGNFKLKVPAGEQNVAKRNIVIVVLIVVLICIAIFGIFIMFRNSGSVDEQEGFVDPTSGETISDPEGRTPETYGIDGTGPIYLGTIGLTQAGLSEFQLAAYKEAFKQYSAQNGNFSEISVDKETVKMVLGDRTDANSVDSLVFLVVVDREKELTAKLVLLGLSKAQLYLYETGNDTAIFDSGVIDGYEIISNEANTENEY